MKVNPRTTLDSARHAMRHAVQRVQGRPREHRDASTPRCVHCGATSTTARLMDGTPVLCADHDACWNRAKARA